jgi:26S proteasome regulatory subunit N10
MSMEEEAARQAAANQPPPPAPDVAAPTETGLDGASARTPAQPAAAPATDENEEAILQQALAMSEGTSVPEVEMTTEEQGGGDEDLTEEEMIERAIQMSMQPESESEEKKK